jgi:quercetin dioxygenase-like cupin family protein
MALPHAKPGEVVDVSPLGAKLNTVSTSTLVKSSALEVLRLVLPAGKEIAPHTVPGEILVQCLEGRVVFHARGVDRELSAGSLLHLAGGDEHSLQAVENSSLLVTILLERPA